ncbi:MAG TPA: immunoglobulin-like domain-containing protein [Bacillales bacterium]
MIIKKHRFIVVFAIGILMIRCRNYDIKRTDKVSKYAEIQSHVADKPAGIDLTMDVSYEEGQMMIVLDNQGSKKLYFGTPYIIEKKKDGIWYQTKYTYNKGFSDIGIIIKSGDGYTQKEKLNMTAGYYRVIKQLSSNYHEPGDTFTVKNKH